MLQMPLSFLQCLRFFAAFFLKGFLWEKEAFTAAKRKKGGEASISDISGLFLLFLERR